MLEIGSVLDGKYKILNQIGQGGMSIVYLAMNERANKQWAIKEVRKDGIRNKEVVKQGLLMEMNLLKKLRHPNLPSIVDVIDREGSFLIVMDYIEGKTLKDTLEEGPFTDKKVVEWAKQLCQVLSYLHTRNPAIIYRDLKPSNIMLKPDGNIMLIDFGTAREFKYEAQGDTKCLGTRGYAAPEQFGGVGQTDERTDIYCLGTTLYHILTGHNPCTPPYEIYPIRHWNQTLSEGLEKIIEKCTALNPEERYQSCQEVYYDLEHYEELEKEYIVKNRRNIVMFSLCLFMTLLSGFGMIHFYKMEYLARTQNYKSYMEEAKTRKEKQEQYACLEKAIILEPKREEAYDYFIQKVVLTDDILEQEEEEYIRALLLKRTDCGKTVEEEFSNNQEGYERFSYQVGLAYFYCYEEEGNKGLATKWLEIASKAETIKETQRKRAERLFKISQYYANVGKTNKAGDLMISYEEYWKDLCFVTQGDIAKEDNPTTAWLVYQEMLSQIYLHTIQFRQADITQEEITKEIDRIKTVIDKDFDQISIVNGTQKDKKILEDLIRKVEQVVENTYGTIS